MAAEHANDGGCVEESKRRAGLAMPGRPRNPKQLHKWLVQTLGVHVARTAVVEGHAAPFDYLRYVFFEGHFEKMARRPDGVLTIQRSRPPADCVLWANRGGGKTLLGAIATLLDMVFKPGIAVRVLAGSLEQSGRMMSHLHRYFDPSFSGALAAMVQGKVTERRIELTNGSEVEVLAQSQASVRGTHVQKLRCDEVDLFDPAVWEAAQFTTKSKKCGRYEVRGSVECLSTMHEPGGIMHQLMMDAQEGKRTVFKWGVVDVLEKCGPERLCEGSGGSALAVLPYGSLEAPCPLKNECGGRAKERTAGDAGHMRIEDAIAAKGRVGEETWETEMLCARPRRKGLVFPQFRRERHVFAGTGPQHVAHWVVGMDFGFRSPTVILWCAVDDEGALWVMDERCQAEEVIDEHVRAMQAGLARPGMPAWPSPRWIAADPAGNQPNQQTGVTDTGVLRKNGFAVKTPGGAVARGVKRIADRLAPAAGWPRLFIHERCKDLIRSMSQYRYKPGDLENLEPLKDGNDHAVDALRYLVMSLDGECGGKTGNYAA